MPTVSRRAATCLATVVLTAALAACSTGATQVPVRPTNAVATASSSLAIGDDTTVAPAAPTMPSSSLASVSGPPTGRYTCWNISNPSEPPAILWDMWIHDDGTYSTTTDANRWTFTFDGATKRVDFVEGSWAEVGYFGDYRAAGDIVYGRVNGTTKIMIHDPVLEANVGGNRDIITCDLSAA
jgi:hypothetical protein